TRYARSRSSSLRSATTPASGPCSAACRPRLICSNSSCAACCIALAPHHARRLPSWATVPTGHDLWARRQASARPITCSIVFISPCGIQHVAHPAKGRPDATPEDRAEAARLADTIEHIRWRLWHGQVQRALDLIGDTLVILDAAAESVSPHATTAGKVAGVLRGLETYVSGQSGLIIDYATARRNDEPIST